MKNHDTIEREAERAYRQKDRKKRKRMKVSGKSVFALQKLIDHPSHDRSSLGKNSKQK
jgi:hypothetical protein